MAKYVLLICALLTSMVYANDPTRPPHWLQAPAQSAPAFNPDKYQLQQIIQHPQRQVAVINGQLLRVGDEIDGARLVRIDATSVQLRVRRAEYRLSLLSEGS